MPRAMTAQERRESAEARLWARLREVPSGCWEWTGPQWTDDGYGRMWDGERLVLVHRFAYQIVVAVPPRWPLQIDHLCRNRACANPAHMEVVTPMENARRGAKVQAVYCRNGHLRTPDNMYIGVEGGRTRRRCKVCAADSTQRYLARVD